MEFSVIVMSDNLVPAVKEWLSYGKMRGLGQWRNTARQDLSARFWGKDGRVCRHSGISAMERQWDVGRGNGKA